MSEERGENVSLEVRLKRLEEILTALESDQLELERSLALFEEGVGHIREAERTLAEAALRVEEVLSDGTRRPLDGEEGDS
jgi:exodeoxyribonuclease VII small subunit